MYPSRMVNQAAGYILWGPKETAGPRRFPESAQEGGKNTLGTSDL